MTVPFKCKLFIFLFFVLLLPSCFWLSTWHDRTASTPVTDACYGNREDSGVENCPSFNSAYWSSSVDSSDPCLTVVSGALPVSLLRVEQSEQLFCCFFFLFSGTRWWEQTFMTKAELKFIRQTELLMTLKKLQLGKCTWWLSLKPGLAL